MSLVATDATHPLESGSLEKQIIVGASGNALGKTEFVGSAVPGTPLSAFKWQLLKLIYDVNGDVTQTLHARRVKDLISDNNFVHAWGAVAPVKQLRISNLLLLGNTLSIDVDGTTFSQPFSLNSDNTLTLLAANIATRGTTAQVQTFTLDAALVAANVLSVVVDGVPVSATFAVDSNTTLAAFATAVQGQPGVLSAVVTDAGAGTADDRVITITSALAGTPTVLTSAVITAGASQAGVVIATTVLNSGGVASASLLTPQDSSLSGGRIIEIVAGKAGVDLVLANPLVVGSTVLATASQRTQVFNSPGAALLTYGTL